MGVLLGVDFSGNQDSWRAGKRNSNVWIAEVHGTTVVRLDRVQARYPDAERPFVALAEELRAGGFQAAGIDAPFCVPRQHLPEGSHTKLLELVARTTREPKRDFPRGADFRAAVVAATSEPERPKPYRVSEAAWVAAGVATRSTLWNGARGGAPMTAACLELLARAKRPMWPWTGKGPGLLAEAFPAGQLKTWSLPHTLYDPSRDDKGGKQNRRRIVDALAERLELGAHRKTMLGNADAIDAVLCTFGARAILEDTLVDVPTAVDEGWIAVSS